jgi:GntR family transcriptional regulator
MILQIDRRDPLPLYAQLKKILLHKIHSGEWRAGELIPSEHELEQHYSVSRTTIRQTLNELVIDGYLVRQRGRGTFIAQPKIAYDASQRLETNEYYHQPEREFGWKLLSKEDCLPPPAIGALLGLEDSETVVCLRRLRTAGGEIIGLHVAYVPPASQAFMNHEALEEGESLHYLAAHPLIGEARVERTLEATLADRADAELLRVSRGSPILQMERILRGKNGVVIEIVHGRFAGDRFKYRFTI